MGRTVHILNGDALADRFPMSIPGERIIMRECLMDGPCDAQSLDDFIIQRARFISDFFEEATENDYTTWAHSHLRKIHSLSSEDIVYLWFEQDLFCQINLWYCLSVLENENPRCHIVMPTEANRYGFGAYEADDLIGLYDQSELIVELEFFPALWTVFCNKADDEMRILLDNAPTSVIKDAMMLHLQRTPDSSGYGRPERTLMCIMDDVDREDFSLIFNQFSEKEWMYGFGDLQVKKMWKELKS